MDVILEPEIWRRALAGGMLIGVAASILLLFNGRIAGVSGVFGGLLLDRTHPDRSWRALFLVGLVAGAGLFALLGTGAAPGASPLGWTGVAVGGLLVGFGTRLGNGCTSGHGVCGLARLSRRSFAATLSFMAFGFLTVFLIRHVWRLA
jgi:hypothetical protein